jgi:hypothetical protein
MSLNISGLNPLERLALHDLLTSQGFEFEKRRMRRPGSKEIAEHTIGIRLLDKEMFGRVIIGVNLDTERDNWFVAPTWEASQLTPESIHHIQDGKMKLSAAALISKIERELRNTDPVLPEPEKTEPKNDAKPEVGTVKPAAELERYEPVQPEENKQVEEQKEQLDQVPTEAATPSASAQNPQAKTGVCERSEESPVMQSEPSSLEQIIKNVTQDGVKIIKNTKGYSWEISVHSDSIFTAIDKAIVADTRLKLKFGE